MLGLNNFVHHLRLACWAVAALAAATLLSGKAEAVPIAKFKFTAEVYSSGDPWTSNGINVGDSVTGIISYDLASADTQADPDFGRYYQTVTLGVQISVGGFTFASSNYFVDILDSDLFGSDGITFEFNEDVTDGAITVLGLGSSPFFDISSSAELFDGDDLLSNIDLSLFDFRFGGLLAAGAGASQLQYEITSVQRIPEPAAVVLFAAGLLGLTFFAGRCRASSRLARLVT